MPSIINATTSTGLVSSADNSGSLQLATNNGTTAVTIDTSQNVGIGISSPTRKLEVVSGTGFQNISTFRTGDATSANNVGGGFSGESSATAGSRYAYLWLDADGANFSGSDYFYISKTGNSGNADLIQQSNAAMTFQTNGSERMRIDSAGDVMIGRNSSLGKFSVDGGSGMSSSGVIARFIGTSGQSMLIRGNGNVENTNGNYGTLSDAKLKENIVDATPKLDDINKLKVRNYNLIGDDLKQIGFVAQEIEQVFPNIVSESPDIDENGNDLGTTTKTVKTSVLIPILVKAMQELKAELDATKAEIQALKGVA